VCVYVYKFLATWRSVGVHGYILSNQVFIYIYICVFIYISRYRFLTMWRSEGKHDYILSYQVFIYMCVCVYIYIKVIYDVAQRRWDRLYTE